MNCKNLLVTKNDLINLCDVSENADDGRVNVAITQAQNAFRSLICREYFDYLISQNDADTLTGVHLTLMDYLKPYLAWLAYSKYCLIGSQDNTKSGFREQTSENSQPVTEQRLNGIRKNAEEQAMYYQGELFYYLNSNIDSFLLYKNSDCYNCDKQELTFKITAAGTKSNYYE